MENQKKAGIRESVLNHHAELTPRQRAVADFLLGNLPEAPFLSIPELARRSRTSEATVVRLAQRLGYGGFSDLKARLQEELREKVAPPPGSPEAGELFTRDPTEDTLTAVARQEVENIRETVGRLDRQLFALAARAMYRADHIYSFGLGISSYMAELLAYLLTQVGGRATPLSRRYSSPFEQLFSLRASDLLCVFSFPPYSKPTIELAREASERGIPTLAITDLPTAPAARVSRLVLTVQSRNLMFTNSVAAVTVLLNSLVTEIARTDRERAAATASRITRLLARDPEIWREEK